MQWIVYSSEMSNIIYKSEPKNMQGNEPINTINDVYNIKIT